MKTFKGRTARRCNQVLGRAGAFWQTDWFDRWIRDEAEWSRVRDYIHNNPIKAGLAKADGDAYRWMG
jgi:REP element-mobilizing transposase RayT